MTMQNNLMKNLIWIVIALLGAGAVGGNAHEDGKIGPTAETLGDGFEALGGVLGIFQADDVGERAEAIDRIEGDRHAGREGHVVD